MILLNHPALGPMVNAVGAACRICRRVQSGVGAVTKEDRSPVTIADFASQAVISHLLDATFGDIPLVAEESAELLREPGRKELRARVVETVRGEWAEAEEEEILAAIDRGAVIRGASTEPEAELTFVLDPIDGTKGFLRGDQFAVALALLDEGRVVAGILGCPNLAGSNGGRGCIFLAAQGQGTYELPLDGRWENVLPARVSPLKDPAGARICQSVEKAHSHQARAGEIAMSMGVTVDPVAMDSQCKYALVARGGAELYLRIPRDTVYRERIWDHAAGAIVVEEAGGTVTDLDGLALDFTLGRTLKKNRGIIASSGGIHEAVLAAVRATEPEKGELP